MVRLDVGMAEHAKNHHANRSQLLTDSIKSGSLDAVMVGLQLYRRRSSAAVILHKYIYLE